MKFRSPLKAVIKNFILELTYRLWKPVVSSTITRMYQDKEIDSETMHKISAYFDDDYSHLTFSWVIPAKITHFRQLKKKGTN